MKKQVPAAAVVAIALVIVAAAGYFALVRPKGAEAGRLDQQAAELESRIAKASGPKGAPKAPRIAVADLFRLAKAMPDTDDMAGVLLELDSVAQSAGVEFRSIQPQGAVANGSYYSMPIGLMFEGSYYDLTDFLFRLRTLVSVRDETLEADGRLYTLDSLDLHESPQGFPRVEAQLVVSAYGYGTAPASPTEPAPATTTTGTTGTDTTSTNTTSTTDTGSTTAPTTTISSSEHAAAGAGGTP